MKKTCQRCNKTKTVDEFGLRTNRPFESKTIYGTCRQCRKEYRRMIREKNKMENDGVIIEPVYTLQSFWPKEEIENFNELNNIF